MDQKTWLWRKRSGNKSIDEAEISAKGIEQQRLQHDKEAALERTVKNLHEKVASLLCECNAKDNLIVEYAKTAQEAIAGREKAVAEVALRNQQLEAAVQQKVEANERLVHLNAALKDCRQQLSSLKEEQDQRVSEAVDEPERANKRLEEKFTETSKKLADLMVENAQLAKALVMKDGLIEDVSHQMSRAAVEFNELISRLDSAEKENGIFKYEYRVLERELEIQSRCADVANRQHQESVRRASKLDAECQKLRLLVKKQIPGPAVQVKTKREVETEGLERRMGFMVHRLCEVEEENKILKEIMYKRDDEIRLLQAEFTQMRCDESHGNGASRRTMIGDADMSLMDDFVEMERFAIVTVDANSSDASNLESVGKELVPVAQGDVVNPSNEDSGWLQSVLKAMLEQTHVSKQSFDELLEDIRVAIQCRYDSGSNGDPVSGYITWKTPDTETSSNEANGASKLLEPEKNIVSLKTELESLKESKTMIEDQLENQKLINEDLDHQLSVAKVQINEANQKVSALKVELEDRSHCCEELEATCLELQLQLASGSDKVMENIDVEQKEKMLQTGWEITAASAKLAECQETIFSIGRQLKALGPPTKAAESTTDKKSNSNQHSCLRDHMVAEDGSDMEGSPKTKEIISTTETKAPSVVRVGSCKSRVVPGALAIVPSKKRGKGTELLRKLLFRKKRGSSKKVLTIAA